MSEELEIDPNKQYGDPRHGFHGIKKMYQKYKSMLNKLEAVQRHKLVKKKTIVKKYRPITAPAPFDALQIDLAFLPKLRSPLNRNKKGFMVVIDVFSRYLWIQPFTNRKNLHEKLEIVIKRMQSEFGKIPKNITGDNEFATTKMQELAAKYDFKWWFGDAGEKYRTGISEAVIKTIKNMIKRYLTHYNTTKYIDVLQTLVDNYNDTIHDTIRTRPNVAIKTSQSFPKRPNVVIPLKIGDIVRVALPRKKGFTKGNFPYWSKEIYQIVGRDRNRYILKNKNSDTNEKKRYSLTQLQKIDSVNKPVANPYSKKINRVAKISKKVNDRNNIEKKQQIAKIANKLEMRNEAPLPVIDELGYDEGIARNSRRNTNERRWKRTGLDLKNIKNKEERVAIERDMGFDVDEKEQAKLQKRKVQKKVKNKIVALRRSTRIRKKPDYYKPYDWRK